MATYAIGDIQGCYHAFQALLTKLDFDPKHDHLWLLGDLINRGSGSLNVLRWVYDHQRCITVVLGNHDLHAITVMAGYANLHRSDTLQALLDAPDGEKLLTWLRHQNLAYATDDYLMLHAGVLPQWTKSQVLALAKEVESALQGASYQDFLSQMYGNKPKQWHSDLKGVDRLRLITNALTRLRICDADGVMEFKFKGELADIPKGFMPWFDVPSRNTKDVTVLFGHWSALGLQQRDKLYALDTGCLWGGSLSALRLEDKAVFQVPSMTQDAVIKLKT